MNKLRRKDLEKARALIDEARSIIETAAEEERDYYDNMPEAIQASERGEVADEAVTALEEAMESLDTALEGIETAVQ
jgi:hypothetical protein